MAASLASFTGLKNAATFVGAKAEATLKVPAVKAVGTKEVTQAKLKVAINGFGRIGRNFVRCLESRGPDAIMELVANINLCFCHTVLCLNVPKCAHLGTAFSRPHLYDSTDRYGCVVYDNNRTHVYAMRCAAVERFSGSLGKYCA